MSINLSVLKNMFEAKGKALGALYCIDPGEFRVVTLGIGDENQLRIEETGRFDYDDWEKYRLSQVRLEEETYTLNIFLSELDLWVAVDDEMSEEEWMDDYYAYFPETVAGLDEIKLQGEFHEQVLNAINPDAQTTYFWY